MLKNGEWQVSLPEHLKRRPPEQIPSVDSLNYTLAAICSRHWCIEFEGLPRMRRVETFGTDVVISPATSGLLGFEAVLEQRQFGRTDTQSSRNGNVIDKKVCYVLVHRERFRMKFQ